MKLKTPLFKKPYIELDNEQEKELFKLDKDKEIERLKEEYMMLQNASDEVEEEKDKEIEKLNTIIEIKTNRIQDLMSRLSKRQDRIDKAIEYIEKNSYTTIETIDDINYFIVRLDKCVDLLDILKGS